LASALGTSRELSVVRRFRAAGFISSKSSHSGQRVGQSARDGGIAGDVIALARQGQSHRNYIVEVGGKSKSLKGAFEELESMRLKDFELRVVKFMPSKKGSTRSVQVWYYLLDGKPTRCEPPKGE
jgi:hypothetical protein